MASESEEVITYKGADIQKRIPGLLEMIMLDDLTVEMRKMNAHFAKSQFEGATTAGTATATNQEQTFDIPEGNPKWIACSFLNAGPNNAQVKINNKGGWVPLFVNIPQNIDFTGADEKICRIAYQCPVPGNTAVITVVGKY